MTDLHLNGVKVSDFNVDDFGEVKPKLDMDRIAVSVLTCFQYFMKKEEISDAVLTITNEEGEKYELNLDQTILDLKSYLNKRANNK